MKKAVRIHVNGTTHETEVEPRLLLVHYLRDTLGLTGTHVGCETSLCGACARRMWTLLRSGSRAPKTFDFLVDPDYTRPWPVKSVRTRTEPRG